ncbi:hypothetical protein Tco_1006642 [Tanacetum coccineum]|uniref:Uncharacterized protein n=1 Tax=Tanacetum coccineum TaxID=301880 RepID=A0ABQ5FJE1_9ASTR
MSINAEADSAPIVPEAKEDIKLSEFLEKDFILQKGSGRNVELDYEDILPSENTSEHPIEEESLGPDVSHKRTVFFRRTNPSEAHWTAVKNILKYLRNTKDMFLMYGGNPEAELQVKSAKEAVWIRKFIDELGVVPSNDYPIKMNCDNSAAIIIAKESGIQKGARHFQRKYHYVRECIKTGEIDIVKVHTYENLADPFTKALAGPKLTRHARSMGLRPASSFIPPFLASAAAVSSALFATVIVILNLCSQFHKDILSQSTSQSLVLIDEMYALIEAGRIVDNGYTPIMVSLNPLSTSKKQRSLSLRSSSLQLQEELRKIAKLPKQRNSWMELIQCFSRMECSNNIWSIIRRLALSAAVYQI